MHDAHQAGADGLEDGFDLEFPRDGRKGGLISGLGIW